MPFVAPPALCPGDSVAIVAPSGPFDRPSFEAGLALMKGRYRTQFTDGVFAQHRYLAGDDARRGAELNAAFADPAVKAVFTARGGYGAMRLLPALKLAAAGSIVHSPEKYQPATRNPLPESVKLLP